jgi:hypothetical protein
MWGFPFLLAIRMFSITMKMKSIPALDLEKEK